MRFDVRAWGQLFTCVGLLAWPVSTLAEDANAEGSGGARWVPAFSFFSGAQIRGYEGGISSPRDDPPGVPDQGDVTSVFAFVGFSAEIASPKLGRRGPRLFAHVDSALSFDTEAAVAGEGSPGPIEYPDTGGGAVLTNSPETGLNGQGTSLDSEAKPLVVSAGAGLAFEFEALGRTLRLKPSIEWLWQETSVSTELGNVVSTQLQGGSPNCDQDVAPCATVFFGASKTKAFHSLGPGLEIEMDAGRVGPVMFALYASGQAYRVLGDGEIDISASAPLDIPAGFNPSGTPPGSLPPGVEDPVRLDSTFELDPWQYRFGVGLRFRWLPE